MIPSQKKIKRQFRDKFACEYQNIVAVWEYEKELHYRFITLNAGHSTLCGTENNIILLNNV